METLTNLSHKLAPTFIGGGGLTLASITPDPSNIGQWTQVVIALSTILAQIFTLLKKKKTP